MTFYKFALTDIHLLNIRSLSLYLNRIQRKIFHLKLKSSLSQFQSRYNEPILPECSLTLLFMHCTKDNQITNLADISHFIILCSGSFARCSKRNLVASNLAHCDLLVAF